MSSVEGSFWDHVEAFRGTMIRVFVIIFVGILLSLLFYHQIFAIITSPLPERETQLVVLGPAEGIMATFRVAFWFGLVATSPAWIYQILRFILPGLNSSEKQFILPFFILSMGFLAAGLSLAYFITIPLANNYLQAFNQGIGTNLWSLSNYIDYTIILLLGNALAFEFCIILLFLVHFRKLTVGSLRAARRYVIVAIFIAAAILTPPDILSQLMLAFPLICLYELAVIYAKILNRRKRRGLTRYTGS